MNMPELTPRFFHAPKTPQEIVADRERVIRIRSAAAIAEMYGNIARAKSLRFQADMITLRVVSAQERAIEAKRTERRRAKRVASQGQGGPISITNGQPR